MEFDEARRKLLMDSMKYESPITKIVGDIQNQIIKQDEEHLMCSVRQAIGYQVDKEELLKALKYDRDQYRKGYMDAITNIKNALDTIEVIYKYKGD